MRIITLLTIALLSITPNISTWPERDARGSYPIIQQPANDFSCPLYSALGCCLQRCYLGPVAGCANALYLLTFPVAGFPCFFFEKVWHTTNGDVDVAITVCNYEDCCIFSACAIPICALAMALVPGAIVGRTANALCKCTPGEEGDCRAQNLYDLPFSYCADREDFNRLTVRREYCESCNRCRETCCCCRRSSNTIQNTSASETGNAPRINPQMSLHAALAAAPAPVPSMADQAVMLNATEERSPLVEISLPRSVAERSPRANRNDPIRSRVADVYWLTRAASRCWEGYRNPYDPQKQALTLHERYRIVNVAHHLIKAADLLYRDGIDVRHDSLSIHDLPRRLFYNIIESAGSSEEPYLFEEQESQNLVHEWFAATTLPEDIRAQQSEQVLQEAMLIYVGTRYYNSLVLFDRAKELITSAS